MSDSLYPNPVPEGDAPSQPVESTTRTAPTTAAASTPDSASLQEQLRNLQGLFVAALVVMLMLSAVLNLFFLRQVLPARSDRNAVRERVEQIAANYRQHQAPVFDAFENQLRAFAQQHPDFAQRLTKYNLPPRSTAPAAPQQPAK